MIDDLHLEEFLLSFFFDFDDEENFPLNMLTTQNLH